jgi:hypothetical protein
VRFTIPIVSENEEAADAAFRELATRMVGGLGDYVPR